ncbi:MAG TPA: M13 family metallopeptidase N-terminal domain-containing protein, partial [Acidobacteriota bacterium]|nr:M13 family metallopeptidase N-terminal domain-containing protein [Acidobacteriota bacterium]
MRLFGQKLFVGALALSFLAGPFTTLANHPKAPTNPGFDPANLDTKCKPCEDFNQFANGGWVAKTPIPGAYPAWDTFNDVHKQNQDRMRTILEQAAANTKATKGSTEQQIGDFYASGMDLDKIEAAGIKPLQPELKRIDGIRNADDLLTTFAHFQTIGVTTPFKFGSDVDLKDSSKVIAGVNQSGLGLPNRDYYTKTDEKSVKTREEYVKHVAKMLELIGEDPASTTEKAKAILAIETKLAEKSMTPVQLRDPNAVYHLMTQEEFQKLTPSIKWKNFFQVVNPPKFLQVNVAQPEFMKAVNGFMTDISINDWKT